MSGKPEDLLPKRDTDPAVIAIPVAADARRFRILTRVSDDKLRSIPQQVKDCAAYVDAQGGAVDGIYNVGEHSGFSMTESAVYRQLLDDARAGRFHALVVRDTSRLGRDYWEKLGTLRDLRHAKVEFHVVEEGGRFDFEDRLHKVKNFASSWADEEKKKEEIRKSVRATASRREIGLPTTRPPLGYESKRDAALGRKVWRLTSDATKVRAMFSSLLQDPSLGTTELGRPHGIAPNLVHKMLRNRAYTGGFVWRGEFTRCDPQVVPPLVDDATFERAQAILDARRASSKSKPS